MFFKGRFGNGFFQGPVFSWFFRIGSGLVFLDLDRSFHRLDGAKKTDFIDRYNLDRLSKY
jgi:hypothetical protein